jgi:multicomponent K+:H+ antiporter subunit D
MIVFAVKAALFPVQFWLPATYANAPAPVAALFAIMTKVGAYAIIRVHTLAFGPGIPAPRTSPAPGSSRPPSSPSRWAPSACSARGG